MKKIISVILAILVVALFAAPISTFAKGAPTFEVSSANVKAGKEFKVDISIKNNPGIASAKFAVKYDDDLTLDDVDFGDKLEGMTGTSPTLNSPATLNWVNLQEDLTEDTVYATLSFTASKTAAEGKHNIEISYDPGDVFNISAKTIDFKIKNGVVTVSGGSASSASSASSVAKSSSSDAESDKTASKTKTASKPETAESSAVGSVDADGEYVGPEIELEFEDEKGNPIDSSAQATTGAKKATPVWVFIIIAIAAAAGVTVVIIILKNKKKRADNSK